MPVTVELLESERVIYYRITDPFRLSDVRVLQPQIQAIRDQYLHTIHLILDVSATHRFPSDILSARHGSPNIHHPRAGLIFVVSPSIYVRSVAEIMARLANTNKLRMARTEADAWTAVREAIHSEISEPSPRT